MMAKACQPTASLTATFPKTEAKDLQASVGVTCGQIVEFFSRCWFSRLGLPYKSVAIKFLMIVGWHRFHTLSENCSPTTDRSSIASHNTSSKPTRFKLSDHGAGTLTNNSVIIFYANL